MIRKIYSCLCLYFFFITIIIVGAGVFGDNHDLNQVDYPSLSSKKSPQSISTSKHWRAYWGGPDDDYAEDVWVDEFAVYVCGTLGNNTGTPKLILTKYNETTRGYPNQNWNRTWTNGTPTRGTSIWGNKTHIYTTAITSVALILIKWDTNGNQIWNTSWNLGGYYGNIHSIWGIGDYLYACGIYTHDLLLIKWNAEGNEIWNKTWGDTGWEEGFGIWGNEELYTCGSTSSYGVGLNDSLLIKWDLDGDQLWNKTWGTVHVEYFNSIFGYNSSVYACGSQWDENDAATDVLVTKWKSDGTQEWKQSWGGTKDDVGYSIWANQFYIYVCGSTLSYDREFEDNLLIKYSYSGLRLENFTWGFENIDVAKGILGINNDIYICGSYENVTYNQFLLHYFSYNLPQRPVFYLATPNPSSNGTFLLTWEKVKIVDYYNLYKDIHPILDLNERIPYQSLAETNYTEVGLEEGTYFYIITSNLLNTESIMSNPCVVVVDLPNPPDRKISGYSITIIIAFIGFITVLLYSRKFRIK